MSNMPASSEENVPPSSSSSSGSPPTQEPQEPNPTAVIGALLPLFHSSSPSNVLKGVGKGIKTVGVTVASSLAVLAYGPYKGATSGYEKYGVCGAVGGTVVGGVVGAVVSAVLVGYGGK